MSLLNVFQPSLSKMESDAVQKVFESNWLGRGRITKEFEYEWAKHVGISSKNIQSVSTCTEGLFASMLALGIGKGDEVVMPSISFVGAANAVVACGARPVFCDIDILTLNPKLYDIEQVITKRTKAIILLHYGGIPCNGMDDIMRFCIERNISIIEDCACAPVSKYQGQTCGTLGHIGIWSFDSMKIMSTGDGGMIFTHNDDLTEKMRKLLFLGLDNTSGLSSSAKMRWWEFNVSEAGRNAIMNDVTSSIGLIQLRKLPFFVAKRKELFERYINNLDLRPYILNMPRIPYGDESSYYLFWITVTIKRDELAFFLREHDVYTTFRYFPLHLIKYYGSNVSLPNSEKASKSNLCLPLHQAMNIKDVDRVCELIIEFFDKQVAL